MKSAIRNSEPVQAYVPADLQRYTVTAASAAPAASSASSVSAGLANGIHPALRLFALFSRLGDAVVSPAREAALEVALDGLADVYADTVRFIDPAHDIHGRSGLRAYFARLYAEARSCRFTLEHAALNSTESTLFWHMTLRHPALNGGRPVEVPGASHLRHGERVHYHRDYFDLGALVYEHVPVLGLGVRALKRRLGA